MANIANREIKRFHQDRSQITFAYADDSSATTLLVMIKTPQGMLSLALNRHQTQELSHWLQKSEERRRKE